MRVGSKLVDSVWIVICRSIFPSVNANDRIFLYMYVNDSLYSWRVSTDISIFRHVFICTEKLLEFLMFGIAFGNSSESQTL